MLHAGRSVEDGDVAELHPGCRDVVFMVLEMGVVLFTCSLADEIGKMKITPGCMTAVPARKKFARAPNVKPPKTIT